MGKLFLPKDDIFFEESTVSNAKLREKEKVIVKRVTFLHAFFYLYLRLKK